MQVKLPAKLAREMHLRPGDSFYWQQSYDDPSVLLFVPVEVVTRRYEAGRTHELPPAARGAASAAGDLHDSDSGESDPRRARTSE